MNTFLRKTDNEIFIQQEDVAPIRRIAIRGDGNFLINLPATQINGPLADAEMFLHRYQLKELIDFLQRHFENYETSGAVVVSVVSIPTLQELQVMATKCNKQVKL